jgi:transcriptional regulator with XRE-family HTH domain
LLLLPARRLELTVALREAAGLSQKELANRLKTKKTAISRIENHAEDIKLSTLEKVAAALGKRLQVKIA